MVSRLFSRQQELTAAAKSCQPTSSEIDLKRKLSEKWSTFKGTTFGWVEEIGSNTDHDRKKGCGQATANVPTMM